MPTNTATQEATAWEQLSELEHAVGEAREREERLAADRAQASRNAAGAKGALAAYHVAVGAGERDPDDAEEQRLRGEMREAQAGASADEWDARFSGAHGARESREQVRDQFGRENFSRLVAELSERAPDARERVEAAREALVEANRDYVAITRAFHRIAPFGNLDPAEIPPHPLAGDAADVELRFARGLELPIPASLRPEEG